MKSIAIMQPTFLPWIGYFALIDRVDEFVFLDHVQFDKRSWQQRNKIKTANGSIWLSVPVMSKGKQDQPINEAEILYEGQKSPLDKIAKTIEANYSKAPFFKDYAPEFFDFFKVKPEKIADLNITIIKWVADLMELKTPFIKSSDLSVNGAKEGLLIDICKIRSASDYISPPGSKDYLEGSSGFADAGIKLAYHEYNHPQYKQLHGDFEPYMCILDLLFNEGPDSTKIMRKGLGKS